MSDTEDEMERRRTRVLTNGQVLAFITAFWLRRPGLLAPALGLTLAAVAFDLASPWAAGRLIDAVSGRTHAIADAWRAWAVFVGVYVAFSACRNIAFKFWNPLASANMKALTDESFARVQRYSSDWHATTFAGSTVRKLSRAMWGYDQVSDAIVLSLGPAALVLVGLSAVMIARWPAVGLFSLGVVILYVGSTLLLSARYVRPANLQSVAWDSRIGGALADAISGNPTVKAFGAEGAKTRVSGKPRPAGGASPWPRGTASPTCGCCRTPSWRCCRRASAPWCCAVGWPARPTPATWPSSSPPLC
jgi:ATP-binding cassette subfamily B protein